MTGGLSPTLDSILFFFVFQANTIVWLDDDWSCLLVMLCTNKKQKWCKHLDTIICLFFIVLSCKVKESGAFIEWGKSWQVHNRGDRLLFYVGLDCIWLVFVFNYFEIECKLKAWKEIDQNGTGAGIYRKDAKVQPKLIKFAGYGHVGLFLSTGWDLNR